MFRSLSSKMRRAIAQPLVSKLVATLLIGSSDYPRWRTSIRLVGKISHLRYNLISQLLMILLSRWNIFFFDFSSKC